MDHFTQKNFNYFSEYLLRDSPEIGLVLDSWISTSVDYQSTINWRYFNDVLKQIAQKDCRTYFGVDNGLVLCTNEPISEVARILELPESACE